MSSIVRAKHKNGSVYAYRSTSFRSPKTGRPTSKREYLGRVDPETGEIIPKKARRQHEDVSNPTVEEDETTVRILEEKVARLEAELAEVAAERDALRETLESIVNAARPFLEYIEEIAVDAAGEGES